MLAANVGQFDVAVYLLLTSVMLDMTDGRLARRLRATSTFGQQLDSLSDALSFGAAPAFLAYAAILHELGRLGMGVSLLYLLAGIFRLARFNVISDAHDKATRTTGIPIPIGAGYVMAAVLMRDALSPLWAAVVVLAMAAGMVSRWSLPDLKGTNVVSAMLLIGMVNYFAVVFRPTWTTVIWWNVWNVAILIAANLQDRKLLPLDSETVSDPSLEHAREALDP
jgi:CDP-diacylglycerol--serine O-phosphatidyltransferase